MSDQQPRRPGPQPAAHALARWTVLLMGWVWLGEQGQRLDWSFASGVLTVALWWALRLLFSGLRLGSTWPRYAPAVIGALTVSGVLLLDKARTGPAAQAWLLLLAALWALWSATLESRRAPAPCQQPWMGWPPLGAALLTWGAQSFPMPHPGSSVALVLLVAVLAGYLGWQGERTRRLLTGQPLDLVAVLPQTAMGLMMGSLWLGSAWCTSSGESSQTIVGLHLLLMAALPALTHLDLIPRQLPPTTRRALPLALLLTASIFLIAGEQRAQGLVGMSLLALAWALTSHQAPAGVTTLWRWFALGGPALLLLIGLGSPALGPQALQWAYGLLGTLSLVALLHLAWRVAHAFPLQPN